MNVIEAEAMGYRSDVKFPIAVMKSGVQSQAVLDLLFPDPPVTFHLVKGSGPIHLLGNHTVGSKYKPFVFLHYASCTIYNDPTTETRNRKYIEYT